jgi:hypothetical protein
MNLILTPAEVATLASALSEAIGVCVDELVAHGDEDAAYARILHARMDQFSALARKIKLAQEVQI